MRRHGHPQNLTTHIISRSDDELFEPAYTVLNDYFGSRNEMESKAVISARFNWRTNEVIDGYSMLYQLAYITDENDALAAVGDYSVVINHKACESGQAVVVHLSHIWVNPQKPGRGIVKHLMHSLTTEAAELAIKTAQLAPNTPITLVGEMEPYEAGNEERVRRIKVFLYNGLRLVDPASIPYCQPDFRSSKEIAAAQHSSPVPLSLMIRRVNREEQQNTNAKEIKHIVACLYHMYAQGLSPKAIEDANLTLETYPSDGESVALLSRLPA
ncbi:hypothetical protein [Flavobacterium sp. W21_SRS_FM6]|uniref:hypothetical protein n=1 Tax=Flavobacterium sp. W21_SRS_FM6 TaxID=3240268 RepID=UPI003F91E8F2